MHSTPSIGELYQRLDLTAAEISEFCRRWQIVELSLFGSVLRDDFRPTENQHSDVDLLYVSAPDARYGFKFFDMRAELSQLLSRPVDLVSKRGIENSRNFLRRQAILESAQVIYAEGSAVNS
ncbi:MAG: nucleotidyltransferase domain-containing protein [Phormidesmis sp.]